MRIAPRAFVGPLPCASILAAFLAPACAPQPPVGETLVEQVEQVERDERHFSVSGRPELVLSTLDASIDVRTWDRSEVRVMVEGDGLSKEEAAKIAIDATQRDSQLIVDLRERKGDPWPFAVHWRGWGRLKLVVTTPASSDLRARSGDGSISVQGLSGRIDLRAGDGSIRGRDLTGDVRAHTGDGSISLESVSGRLDADSGDGSIVVAGKLTALRLRARDGSITVHPAPTDATDESWDIKTGDGSITLELPGGFNAEMDAYTGDGHINLDDVTISNVSGRAREGRLRGRLGSGGRAIYLRTGDGSISLKRS
jgi:hypothetical protein